MFLKIQHLHNLIFLNQWNVKNEYFVDKNINQKKEDQKKKYKIKKN
jgi:hypothetical protein